MVYETIVLPLDEQGSKTGATCGNRNRAYALARRRSATIPTSLRKFSATRIRTLCLLRINRTSATCAVPLTTQLLTPKNLQIRITNNLLSQVKIIKSYCPQRDQSEYKRSPSDLCDVLDLFIFRHGDPLKNWSGLRKSNSLGWFGRPVPNQSAKPAQKLIAKIVSKIQTRACCAHEAPYGLRAIRALDSQATSLQHLPRYTHRLRVPSNFLVPIQSRLM